MKGEAGEVLGTGQRNVIRRPRLTRLLDDASARVILLIAPAGYGKTTLAREWLNERPHVWYRGNTATGDVAALGLGLAEACSAIIPRAADRLKTRLRFSRAPSNEVERLADLLVEDLRNWPGEAWLAFDDYHFACDSDPAERFIEHLLFRSEIRLIVASRSRPRWATARRVIYGEVVQIGRTLLAMDQQEALQTLQAREATEVDGLLSIADGWPALLGLAAVAAPVDFPGAAVPDELFAYFAEELYSEASPTVQRALRKLALAPYVDFEIAEAVLGDGAMELVAIGVELGFLGTGSQNRFEFHPLLKLFLTSKFHPRRDDPTGALIANLANILMTRRDWDATFALAAQFGDTEILSRLLQAAVAQMLDQARLPTLMQWLETTAARGFDSPLMDLTDAELAFRRGELQRAEAVACQAARRLEAEDSPTSRAFWIAGMSAHLTYRDETSLEHFRSAHSSSLNDEDLRQALWGQFIATESLERKEEAAELLRRYIDLSGSSVDELLRIATAQFRMAQLAGSITATLEQQRSLVHLATKSRDHFIRSSFLNTYVALLVIAGEYENALREGTNEIDFVMDTALDFALPFAHLLVAGAQLGLRRFGECKASLRACERTTFENDFITCNMALVHARLRLATHQLDEALEVLDRANESAVRCKAMLPEFLVWSSFTQGVVGHIREAVKLADDAEQLSNRIEVAALLPWIRTAIALRGGGNAERQARQAFRVTLQSGNIDAFVTVYRACPQILKALASNSSNLVPLKRILGRAYDHALAESVGLPMQPNFRAAGPSLLKVRQQEVIELVSQGLTNKEIGRTLFITEATVKVHVRKICQKFGVRSRTEAAMRAAELSG